MKIQDMLEAYSIDIEFALSVSPFEFKETLSLRDYLEQVKDELSLSQREELRKSDQMLISKANELYQYLEPIKLWGNNISTEKWWWHLDKVANKMLDIKL